MPWRQNQILFYLHNNPLRWSTIISSKLHIKIWGPDGLHNYLRSHSKKMMRPDLNPGPVPQRPVLISVHVSMARVSPTDCERYYLTFVSGIPPGTKGLSSAFSWSMWTLWKSWNPQKEIGNVVWRSFIILGQMPNVEWFEWERKQQVFFSFPNIVLWAL